MMINNGQYGYIESHKMGGSIKGGTPLSLDGVLHGKSHRSKCMRTGGTPIW